MEKVNFTKQFAHRLHEAMIAAGFNSTRSSSGVSIHKLTEITGYSLQICRKYLRGEAIPEPAKLVDIANSLHVSAGWLLFGEPQDSHSLSTDSLIISKTVLHYVFAQASSLYHGNLSEQEIPSFLLDLINDLTAINATEEQSKKIIDLALSSVKHFTHPPAT